MGAALYSRVSSPTIPAPFLASLVTPQLSYIFQKNVGSLPLVVCCGEPVPQETMAGCQDTTGPAERGALQLSRGHKWRSHLPLHSAVWTFAWEAGG